LSSLNGELVRRMSELRFLIGVLLVGLVVTLGLLGRALLVTRRTEAELRTAKSEVEATQQTTLDASPIGIVYVDAADPQQGRIVKANRQMNLFFAAPIEHMVGRPLLDLIESVDVPAELGRAASKRLASGDIVRCELRFRRDDGSGFWGALSGKAIEPSEPGLGVVWTLENIDERKRAERELRQAREQAEAASRTKSEFLANISHEIRTPFTAILGVLDTLLRSRLDAEQQKFARLAQNSARQLLAIVNDILDISKIEAGKLTITPTPIDLPAMIDEAAGGGGGAGQGKRKGPGHPAAAHRAAASEKGIGLVHRLDGQLPPTLRADAVRLRQIIDNLLSNAIKFTREGGVAVSVHCAPAKCRDWTVRIEVSDSGIGIACELHEMIFEKFTQADSSTTRLYGGTGLGLAICRQLTVQMGGRIGVQSVPGIGSTFWVELTLPATGEAPITSPAPLATSTAPRSAGRHALAGIRIVLAEDCADNATILVAQMRAAGAELRHARNGLEAVALVGQWQPDVLLLDCQMPELDGYAATRRIRAGESAPRRTPIIALTAHALEDNRERCLAQGMDDFLSKPVDFALLVQKLQTWAGRDNPVADEVQSERFDGQVLLVDDNALVREASRGMLETFGVRVTVAASGEEALQHCRRDDLDLVLMDCRMPEMDGLATARRWRERERNGQRTAIIAVSAEADSVDLRAYRDAGMDDFLAKPYNVKGLAGLLGRWLGPAQ
jgi:two-component system, sensor histidine kinase and response regulator